MNKYREEKKKQVVLVIVATVGLLAGLYFGLLAPQQRALAALQAKKGAVRAKYDQAQAALRSAEQIEASLVEAKAALTKLEADMASGDLYSWAINKIREFKGPYNVEIPQFGQIEGPQALDMIPSFPYQQAKLAVGGRAHFYDFGKFVADFENAFPYMRLANLTLEPVSSGSPDDREKLNFRFELVTLVKPNNS